MIEIELFQQLQQRINAAMVGQAEVVEHLLIGLLADGHVLLEGAPGLAKTRLARLLAEAFDVRFNRIQFTPDLLPSDLTGSAIYDQREQRFEFQQGPLFSHFILADEINRAPAKVQSALLEAMEERQISSGNSSYQLEQPFFVMATQNPIEHDGTWELPQAQLDRFLLHITVDYPRRDTEREILDLVMAENSGQNNSADGRDSATMSDLIRREQLARARREVMQIHVAPLVRDYIVRLISGTRNDPQSLPGVGEHLAHPVSPRGSIALARSAQARAWLRARDHVVPDDISALAAAVLRHRLGLNYRAEADGVPPDSIITALLEQTDVV